MKELIKDIRNGDEDDDNMNYDKFKDSSVYKNAKEDLRRCIDLANKVGKKLGDYEIVNVLRIRTILSKNMLMRIMKMYLGRSSKN